MIEKALFVCILWQITTAHYNLSLDHHSLVNFHHLVWSGLGSCQVIHYVVDIYQHNYPKNVHLLGQNSNRLWLWLKVHPHEQGRGSI